MSTGYGVNKGKDGNKYNTLNLTTYKGRSVDSSKHSGTAVRHGLKSLGKVASTRRVPPPASLPSLKSENLGNDPNVNLVPKDGSGWASKSEQQNSQQSQQVSQAPPESQPRQASTMHSQQQSTFQASNQSVPNNRNQNSSTLTTSGQSHHTWGSSQFSQVGRKASGAIDGGRGRGITPFSDEFPTLSDTQKDAENSQNNDKTREQQYGPGPSLRPQNVASWREGGGRNLPPTKDINVDDTKSQNDSQQSSISAHGYDMNSNMDGSQVQSMSQRGIGHQGMGPNPPQNHSNIGSGTQGYPIMSSHSQGHPSQYRQNAIPQQYMYRVGHPSGMGPPGPRGRYPPNMYPGGMRHPNFSNDPRFRGMMRSAHPQQGRNESVNVPPIIPHSDFKNFDKLDDDEGDWAGMHGEVDYQEKLVFSDDEDVSDKKRAMLRENSSNEHSNIEKHRKEVSLSRQVWAPQPNSYGNMDPHSMQQWNPPYYGGYGGPGPSPLDMRSKPQMGYDKRMPAQGQQYPAAQIGPMYGRSAGPRYMMDPSSLERESPGGEEEHRRKDKEEAMERAKKRKEDEERRMAMQHRSISDERSYPPMMSKPDPRYQQHFDPSDDGMKRWSPNIPDYAPQDGYNQRRPENENSDDRRNMRDRMPTDGFGQYRAQPHPSAGSQSGGRNLPPRLANQQRQQQQERWQQPRIPSPNYQGYDNWGMSLQQTYKQEEPRIRTSIMKRDRMGSEGSEDYDIGSRSRKQSDTGFHSQMMGEKDTVLEDRRHGGRDFYRKEKKVIDDKRNTDNTSPSTAGSDREQRLWDGGSKRSLMKRQSSRDSPVIMASTGDSRRGSQKTLLSRSDSGNKPVTKLGSCQSNKSLDKDEGKQLTVRTRRSEKVKLRDFRVEGDDDNENGGISKKPSGRSGSDKLGGEPNMASEPRTWKSDTKVTKPIATVLPSTSTTSTVTKVSEQKKTAVTSSGVQDEEPINDSSQETSSLGGEQEVSQTPQGVSTTHTKSIRRSEPRSHPNKDRHDNKDRRPRTTPRENRDHYEERSDRNERRYKESRQHERDAPRERHNDNRPRRYDDSKSRPQDRQRRNDDRYENRNSREGKEQRRDGKREHMQEQFKVPSNQQTRKGEMSKTSKPTSEKPATSVATTMSTVTSTAVTSTTLKQTMAAPSPTTNIWEERKKLMQKDGEKNTYIPKEEDKKRTLKETAPVMKVDVEIKSNRDDKPSMDSKKHFREETNNKSARGYNKSSSFNEKRSYDGGFSYRDNGQRRGSSSRQPPGNDRKQSVENSYESRNEKRGGRGRGRSRGSSYPRGGGRGRGGQTTSLDKPSSTTRGRGRGSRRGGYSRSTYSRGSHGGRPNQSKSYYGDGDYSDSSSDGSYSGSDNPSFDNRRRKVGEASDAEDYSTESFTDDEYFSTNPQISKRPAPSHQENIAKPETSRSNNGNFASKPNFSESHNSTFAARGEPSRRGRGRGTSAGTTRGRGRGGYNQSRNNISAPPNGRGRRSDDYQDTSRVSKNGERGPQGGAGRRRGVSQSDDKRKRTRKADKPPRFKNNTSRSSNRDFSSRDNNLPPFNGTAGRQDEVSPSGDVQAISSDVGNDEWETASDNSSDFRKVTLKTSEPDDGKRSEPKRSFTTQRPSSANRGHGGKGGNSGRGHYDRSGNSKTNSQVYTLHGVDYSNPSAIEGALRDASLNQDFDKMKKAPKSRHEELFRRYDLHNYAGVVSVDDLPDVSSKRMLQNEQDIISDDVLDAVMDFSPVAGNKDADDDGFTPVLSKRALKKKQGEMRKKDEEEKMLQAVRKMKLKQQQKNRQKFFGKQNHIASGTSGSIKQPISSTNLQSELWPNIETWKPQENAPEQIEACADVSISQHDSGVESSVPSSQRSSPGTEAKLSFSHFGVSITSTSVITSICDHQVSSTSSVIHESVGIAGLMKEKQNNIDLKESDLMSGLKESSPASSSPSRSNGNMIRPIGNERVKIMKVSEPVDNIASLFHSVKDKNVISFVAENSDESGNPNTVSNLFPSDELRDNTFSPFGEPPIPQSVSGMIDSTSRHGFPSFSQSDFTEVTVQPTLSVHSSTYLSISQFTKSANSSGESPTTHSLVNNPASNLSPTPEAAMMEQHVGNFRHPMQSSALPNGFLTPLSPSINKLPLNKAGASSESDPTEDMSLNPQAPTNPNVTHNPHSLEGSSIPEPIPLPPKYPTGSSQGPDGDVQAGVMPALDVNAKATGAGDMGLMTPTSPSNDLNIKMELGRKAWENMLESSSAPSQQQGANTFHQSTDTVHLPEQTVVETSNVQSVSLSVTKSTEWKPRQHSSTPTASSGSSESWRNTTSQPHQGQISQTQDFVKNTAVTAGSETTSSTLGLYRSGTTVTVATTQTPHHQPVAPPYSSGYMYFDPNSQIFSPTPRVATVQGSHSNLYQTISATSLATNLHNMQHAYPTNLPPDYAPSLYTSQNPGYSSLTPQVPNAGYSAPQHRDYVPNQPMLLTSAVGSATIKPSPQNTLGLKPSQQPHQAALRSGSATANYGAGSSMPSMNQTNIGSAQLTIPRQHGGAVSPAQPIFIPVLDQSRVIAGSQANPSSLINQALNTPQRPQSTSFYSQLNQGNSSYYPQQPGSQLHRQQGSYQQALSVPSYPQGISYHAIKPMSPTQPTQMGMDAGSGIWTLGNVQQTAAYQPIAPPSHRLGNDNDSSQQSMQYYASKGPYLGPNKVSQSVSQTSGGFGVAKPSIPSSTYGGNKTSQSMYPPSDITTPSNQDQVTPSGHSMSKYSMPTSSASKAYMGQQDWSKPASSTSLQYRQYAVQGLLSRPFSSSIDSMTQQSPSNTSYSGKPQDMTSSRMTFRPPNPSQSHSFNPQQAGWGHSKPPQGNPGLMGSQPLTNMLTTPKGPRPPMVPSSMMGQGYTNPQVFQASSSLSPPQMSSQQPVPYPMNMGGGGGMRITSPTSVPQQFGPMHDNRASAKHGKGGKQGHVTSSHSTGKAPPVPTLVRGAGSNLVGKKPTFMSEEVIKSKQASERANLLESLSSFFPDKAKDDGEKGGDTAAPARSPPPKRRPGMRSAGIEKRRMGGDMKNGGKNSKRSQKNGRKEESADVDSIVRPVKKMTLADTKPKKGETAKIQLKGQAKP